jgi:V/A-type H+/Na+-transporting ATPase subunit E
MENKLQELTNKIYSEGIEKANREAEEILSRARADSEKMRSEAEKEAAEIITKAEKEAEDLKKNVHSEIRLSARQAVNSVKQKITGLVTAKPTGTAVKKAMDDREFMQKIIVAAIKNWDPKSSGGIDIAVLLPEKDRKELNDYFSKKQKELLDNGLELKFDDGMRSGFKIGPKDGSYQISFTEEDFENFFRNYLRPRTTELLYSGE